MKTLKWLLIVLTAAALCALALVFWPQLRTLCRSMSSCCTAGEKQTLEETPPESVETV